MSEKALSYQDLERRVEKIEHSSEEDKEQMRMSVKALKSKCSVTATFRQWFPR
mgnify:FL=1